MVIQKIITYNKYTKVKYYDWEYFILILKYLIYSSNYYIKKHQFNINIAISLF